MNGRLLLLLLSWVAVGVAPSVAEAEGRAAWGDWVVAGDDADTGASILLRRITPKSVFVAPTFTGCSEGYRQDSLGRCVKLVKVNQQSQWNFFLERLNSMYAPSSNKKPQKETGPFHINLPLASENPVEESVVKKRLPPRIEEVKTTQPTLPPVTSTATTTTTTPVSQTSTLPTTTTMSESTTAEVPLSTVVEPSEVTNTEKEVTSTETTAETRRDTTTEGLDIAVMLGDQPYKETVDESFDTPKSKDKIPQLQEKPFLIIVTNPTVTRSETTPTFLPTEEDEDETSTTVATTEGNAKYTTEMSTKTDESFGESKDATETSIRPAVSIRPGCEDPAAFEDCEPVETEAFSGESSPSSLPELPLVDPSSQVRFPSESFVPVRKTQSFVRFPDVANPHEDRPAFWWPSWQIRQYPGIHGWPESSEQNHGSTDRVIQRKHPYGTTWSGTMAWQRRFLQRD